MRARNVRGAEGTLDVESPWGFVVGLGAYESQSSTEIIGVPSREPLENFGELRSRVKFLGTESARAR